MKQGIKNAYRSFPGGAVVENLPANAGDTGSSPGLGRSHMPGDEEWPPLAATKESPRTETKTQHSQK